MTPDERARAAKRLADDPLFEEALKYLRETAVMQWSGTSPEDETTRTEAYFQQRAVTEVRQLVRSWAGLSD